jgi:uncharacterized protein YuzE
MMISVDTDACATYITLTDAPIARTEDVTDLVMVDLDAQDHPVGVEFLLMPTDITDELVGLLEHRYPDLHVLAKDPSQWRLAPA